MVTCAKYKTVQSSTTHSDKMPEALKYTVPRKNHQHSILIISNSQRRKYGISLYFFCKTILSQKLEKL